MAYSETTTTSYGNRLTKSLKGILTGLVLFIIGTIILFWNEGNYIKTFKAIKEAESVVVPAESVSTVDSSLNGKLIHASALATTEDRLYDDLFGVNVNAVKLKRQVEYYQWVEEERTETHDKIGGGEETITTYTYKTEWRDSPVEVNFHDPEYRDRNFVLAKVEKKEQIAANVTFGAYTLPDFLKESISGDKPAEVNLTAEQIKQWENVLVNNRPQLKPLLEKNTTPAVPTAVTPPAETAPTATLATKSPIVHTDKNIVYFGENSGTAQVGDVRVTLTKVDPATISIIAKVNGSTFEKYHAKSGKEFSGFSMGTVSADKMFEDAHQSNTFFTWLLRIVGTLAIIFALNSMFSIIPSLFKVLPFLGNIAEAGVGLVCAVGGFAWSVLVIAIAWFFYRPLIGVALLVLVVASIWYLGKAAKDKKALAKNC